MPLRILWKRYAPYAIRLDIMMCSLIVAISDGIESCAEIIIDFGWFSICHPRNLKGT